MTNDTDIQLQSIDSGTLTPLVRQALGSETAEITGWNSEQVHASATRASILRFAGDAEDQGDLVPWSLILKIVPFSPDRDDPSSRPYWKREVLAYQSGLLDDLPAGLAAPRCLGVVEQPGGEYWLWMEEVHDDIGANWPLAHYGVVARHLGQFNGAYLMGKPVPTVPWLSKGWVHERRAQADLHIAQLRDNLDHPLVRRVYPPAVAESIFRLCEERELFLAALDKLPRTFCHHDAFRRNLFAQRNADGGYQTVAIDWAFMGTGAIGEELRPLVIHSVLFFEVEAEKLPELDAIAFDGYLTGLREAGWRGDGRMARLGYTASTALGGLLQGTNISILTDESRRARWEQVMGRPMEQVADCWLGLSLYGLGLQEEARRLMDEL